MFYLKFMLILNQFWNGLNKIIGKLILLIFENFKIIFRAICIDDKFSKPVFLYRGKNAVNKFIEFLKNMNTGNK